MPSAPLFYQPLVQARVLATKIGDTTVFDAQKVQSETINKAYQDPKFRPKMDAIMRGFEGLQAELPGSKTLDNIQFAFDETGYVANRIGTTLRLHQEMFDTASPDQAAEMGAKLVIEAQKELAENPGMRAVGDTLEVAPDVTFLLKQHWEGNDLSAGDAAYVGVTASRELQRAVTPLAPDATHPTLQWVEDASMWMLGMWPGAASRTAAAIGLKADGAEIEKLVDGWRQNMDQVEPKVAQPIRSLNAVLGAAGITGSDDAARAAAFQVLQSTPLEGVPAGIAQGIVATNELAPDKAGYFAGRIVETGGTAGNIAGMLAEIELMKRPPPVEPPPGGTEPPPGGGTPPPGPVDPTPPPGGTPTPPVDPPAKDPAKVPDKDPAKEPDKDPAKEPDKDGGGDEQVTALTGQPGAGGTPMSQADFDKLLAEVRAEIDAEQGGPHPVNDPANQAAADHGHEH
jgi:outer membrane biosynthesis protein TonB